MFNLRYFPLALLFIFSPSVFAAQKPEVLLCVEKDSGYVAGKKLVYGYIYGVKTECMPENEFLDLYAKKTAEIEKAIRLDTISNADAILLIQNGEKNLAGAKFKGFDFMDISFKGINCKGADFEGADLRNTSFQNANCTKTNFAKAFLKKADFKGTTLKEANFAGAFLAEVEFTGAKGLKPDMFKSAVTLYNAAFDAKLETKIKNLYPDLFKKPKKCWETNTWLGDSTDCDENNKNYKFPKIKE